MDFTQQATIVGRIHDKLVDCKGEKLRLRANMGRSRIIEVEGILTQAHPSLFIMEVPRKRGRAIRQSYQYVDILTGTVELSRPVSHEPLFPTLIEDATGEAAATAASNIAIVDELDDEDEDDV
jgi:uncharacterized protein Veg